MAIRQERLAAPGRNALSILATRLTLPPDSHPLKINPVSLSASVAGSIGGVPILSSAVTFDTQARTLRHTAGSQPPHCRCRSLPDAAVAHAFSQRHAQSLPCDAALPTPAFFPPRSP